jgi:putative protein kinase ArgK-like GTPase of G3E family
VFRLTFSLYQHHIYWRERCKGDFMKLAISGKGGVGKSTLSALLAQVYADQGRSVLAVDADPSPCLAGALGYPDQKRARLSPISEMNQLIEERTGAKPGTMGGSLRSTRVSMISVIASASSIAVCICSKWAQSIWAVRAAFAPKVPC